MSSAISAVANDAEFRINIISAADANRGIGNKGVLPWSLPGEGKYFHGIINHTSSPEKQNAVIIGRISYESIHDPADYEKILKVVVTRVKRPPADDRNLHFVGSFDEAIAYLQEEKSCRHIETIWSLGGAGVYKHSLESPFLYRVYLTEVLAEFECDTHFPEMDLTLFRLVQDSRVPQDVQTDSGYQYQVKVYERKH